MTHTHRFSAFLGLLVVIALAGLASTAAAQTPRFRVTPLVKLGFTPDADVFGTLGINNKGQVVYGYVPEEQSSKQAWLWLPTTDYGFGSAGFKDLSALSSSTDDTPGIAREINESGLIVGQGGAVGVAVGRAAVWSISSGTVTHTQLGTLSGSSAPFSSAHAVNDDSPAIIVGDSNTEDECDCDTMTVGDRPHGFRLTYNAGSSSTLNDLSPGSSVIGSARDIHTPAGGGAPQRIAGFVNCPTPTEKDSCDFVQQPECDGGDEAVDWQNGTRVTLDDFDTTSSSFKGSQGRGVNNPGETVGWARTDEDDPDCTRHALYWATPTSAFINLGTFMPSGQSTHESRAEAINNLTLPQVVGWNINNNNALLWEKTSMSWNVTDLNSTAAIGDCAGNVWDVREAHDINDDTWIVGWGVNADDLDTYALLLTPFPDCPADVDRNGCINIDDLLAVIEHYGPCPIGVMCIWDVDGTCGVDTADVNVVDEAWCPDPCPDPVPSCCESCPHCGDNFGAGGGNPRPTLSEMIALVSEHAPEWAQSELIQWLIANW